MKVREEEIKYKQKVTLELSDFHRLLTRGAVENEEVRIEVTDKDRLAAVAELI